MADKTRVEWADASWSPIIGCSPVSIGCDHCWARSMARRFFKKKLGLAATWRGFHALSQTIEEPLHWRKPRRVFALGMTDFCHPNIPLDWLDDCFEVMKKCPQHTFVMLTKRPEYIERVINGWSKAAIPNVIMGVSAENQETFDKRFPWVIRMKAMGWRTCLSCEPLLENIDMASLRVGVQHPLKPLGVSIFDVPAVNWVIAGCESGPGARRAEVDWFRSLRSQCEENGIPFFLKQMSSETGKRIIEKTPMLDGRQSINGPLE